MSITRMLVFLAVVVGIIGGVHTYFWLRLVRDTALPFPYRAWVGGALIALAVSMPLAFATGRRLPPPLASALAWPAFIWMGLMAFLFTALVATDLIKLALWAGQKVGNADPDPSRRLLIARLLGGGSGLLAGLAAGAGLGQALRPVNINKMDVQLRRLPRGSHGLTIAQLTDVHVGPTIGRAFIEDLVRRTNALSPDIIAITGDLVDGSVETLGAAVAPLGGLRARHGVYFVTGNHEYYSGADEWMNELRRLGIRVLANERVTIGEGADAFDLAGVHDPAGRGFHPDHAPDLGKALAGRDPARELVLLAHQPRAITEAAHHGVGLQLSGHTHGGQFWPFSYVVKLAQPYLVGLHRHGDTQIYVSPGTGYWGPPLRLGTRAEITHIRLLSVA